MVLKLLGTGCPSCQLLEKNMIQAIKMSGEEHEIVKVQEIPDILNYGVMMTPALVINEKVKFSGKILKAEDILKIINEEKEA